jgi:hypothetical protein
LYCRINSTTAGQLLPLESKGNFNLLCDTITKLERKGNKGSYIDGIRKAVLSWLRFNGIVLPTRVLVKDAKRNHVTTKMPEPSEVLETLAAATVRTKVSVSLVAYSGLRLES